MRKFLPVVVVFLFSVKAFSQITVTSSDFASAGDTAYLTQGQINLFLDYAVTDTNYSWDFSNLRATGQQQTDFLSVSSTNIIYALFYANLPFNINRANIALQGTDIPFSTAIGITNPYTFYYKSASAYKKVGYGGELAGLPIPIPMNNHDTIYRFPLDYGNMDSSYSDYEISLTGIIYYGYVQSRFNHVDGWGTVITPHGSFAALRIKTEIFGSDSVYIDSLGFGFSIARPKITEYKWIANNELVPVLTITTTEIFGFEIITSILFKDDKLMITTDTVSGPLCPGSSITVDYTASGTYNAPAFLQPGNDFIAQLSDDTGSFVNAVDIGSVTATASGGISCIIPSNTPPGTGYKIRVMSTSPVVTGSEYGPFTIDSPASATVSANGNTTFCLGDSVELVAGAGAGYSYQWQLNGADISGAVAQNYLASQSGNYSVVVSNSCSADTSSSIPVVVNPLPVHSVPMGIQLSCNGAAINILASNISSIYNVSYQWYEGGNMIAGANDSIYSAMVSGNYSVEVTDTNGCKFVSTVVQVIIDSLTAPNVYASGPTSLCAGDSLLLSADTLSGVSYQWLLNGNIISGANGDSYLVTSSGDYSVVITNANGCTALSSDVTVTVNPLPAQPVITQNGDTLHSTTAVAYQWYLNGTLIPGAASQWIAPGISGSYTVVITDSNGCTNTSAPFPFSPMGLNEHLTSQGIIISPNPVLGELSVHLTGRMDSSLWIEIYDASGKTVLSDSFDSDELLKISIAYLHPGMYHLRVVSEDAIFSSRFIRQ